MHHGCDSGLIKEKGTRGTQSLLCLANFFVFCFLFLCVLSFQRIMHRNTIQLLFSFAEYVFDGV